MTKKRVQDIFPLDREIRADIRSYIQKALLYPFFWTDHEKHIPPSEWTTVPFNAEEVVNIPTKNGVYAFLIVPPSPNNFIAASYLMYVGKAESMTLRARFKNYLKEKDGFGKGKNKPRPLVQEFLSDYEGYTAFRYTVLPKEIVLSTETKLLNTYAPYVNAQVPEATISRELQYLYR